MISIPNPCPFVVRPLKATAVECKTIFPSIPPIYQSLTLIFHDKTKLKVAFLTRFPRTRQFECPDEGVSGHFFCQYMPVPGGPIRREGCDGQV